MMKLHITCKSKPEAPGFIYVSSNSARQRGPDAEKRELRDALRMHLNHWTQETVVVDGVEVVRALERSDVVARLVDDDGNEIEAVPVPLK